MMESNKECSDISDAAEASSHCRAFVDAEDNLKFHPPLYIQRYETVKSILRDARWASTIQSIVEFGCAELAMFSRFKDLSDVTKIVLVDIDPIVLEFYSCRAAPLNSDFLNPRKKPLHVDVLCGSVADCDSRTVGADAVVCIELIEHLYNDVVEGLEFTIFGYIMPKIAIFTTPNSDFNVLLKGLGTKFRHADHKFEWSRAEFKNWTDKIVSLYPYYRVEIRGVGNPPVGKESVGCCSQLAIFIRNSEHEVPKIEMGGEIYNVCRSYDHPVFSDHRTDEEKLLHEVQYCLHTWSSWEMYAAEDEEAAYIPLDDVVKAVQKQLPNADINSVRGVVEGEYIDCDVVDRDGVPVARYNRARPPSSFSDEDFTDEEETHNYAKVGEPDRTEDVEDEMWDDAGPPIVVGPLDLEQIQRDIQDLSWARLENEVNLIHERELILEAHENDSNDSFDSDSDTGYYWTPGMVDDCEKRWNHTAVRPPFSGHSRARHHAVFYNDGGNSSQSQLGICSAFIGGVPDQQGEHHFVTDSGSEFVSGERSERALCFSSSVNADELHHEHESVTISEVDAPLLKNKLLLTGGTYLSMVTCNINSSTFPISKKIPKSTSVEVLHLDGSPPSKRSAGLECIEFSSWANVTLCYTGKTYHHSKTDKGSAGIPVSPEHKSLDGSLLHDVSLDIDQAGDSGYPNSSSLHHDIDVDLTPEQVDDISSENGDPSNQSISDESDVSDRSPAALRRIFLPRRPFVPIMFENVENGDLANNNRDGEGNNAVPAPGDDEREFVAVVEEGDMLPLMAVPDIILPDDADPFPAWLSNLLGIDDEKIAEKHENSAVLCSHQDGLTYSSFKLNLESDEGLGDDDEHYHHSDDLTSRKSSDSNMVLEP